MGRNSANCKLTVNLARGKIRGTLKVAFNANSGAIKIVGGTGKYAGATGTGNYRNLDDSGDRTAVTLRLN